MKDVQATADRPLPLRRRPDLITSTHRAGSERYVVVKDPIALRYYQLRAEENYILGMLDGKTSLAEIRDAFHEKFAPARVGYRRLQAYLERLLHEGLVLSEADGEGLRLSERAQHRQRAQRLAALPNVLAIRFRGIDPDRMLDRWYPRLRWLFSPAVVGVALLLALVAASTVLVNFAQVQARAPEWRSYLNAGPWLGFAAALACCKILHELGHAFACKHYGGRCHELGVLLLVFTPCLYVNVSDAWLLPDRWQRMVITAAGIGVEIVLASMATIVWWWTESGWLHDFCWCIMVVGSVSTILFNGNPLLRYDGYYLLSDLVQIPNLHDRSRTVVRNVCLRGLFGVATGDGPGGPPRHPILLGGYAVASLAYRWLLILVILLWLNAFLRERGLQVLGQLLTVLIVAGMVLPVAWRGGQWMHQMRSLGQIRSGRSTMAAMAILGLLAGLLLIPYPTRIRVPAVLQPAGATGVYVTVPGQLDRSVAAGRYVSAGHPLARLENEDLALELLRLQGRQQVLQQELEALIARDAGGGSGTLADPASLIPTVREALADVRGQQERLQSKVQQLEVTATVSGRVLPPPSREPIASTAELPGWTGSPLDPENRGAYLETGTLLCLLGDPQRLEAALVVSQREIRQVQRGQSVRLRFRQSPGRIETATVTDVAKLDVQALPPEFLAAGVVPVRREADGRRTLEGAYYLVRVALEETRPPRCVGGMGRAAIHASPRSAARRIFEWACGTFRFLP